MKKSLQEIEDFYKNKGYGRTKLRKILGKDKEWNHLVRERIEKLNKKVVLTKTEKKKYVMSTDQDYEILDKIKQRESGFFSKNPLTL